MVPVAARVVEASVVEVESVVVVVAVVVVEGMGERRWSCESRADRVQ